jgi:hypothetical protein
VSDEVSTLVTFRITGTAHEVTQFLHEYADGPGMLNTHDNEEGCMVGATLVQAGNPEPAGSYHVQLPW